MKKIIILVLTVLLLCGCSVELAPDYYECKDLEGNTRMAEDCWIDYGQMVCKLDDGTKISVQSYKGIYDD